MTTPAAPNLAQINQLAARLQAASDVYYNGTPSMTDAAWDALADELRKLDPGHPALKAIGAPVPAGPQAGGGWAKTKHTIPMASLNKANTLPEMQGWLTGCKTTTPMAVMDKLDGGSLDLVYENRHLIQGITRGDGQVGEDITRNVLLMQGAVKMLPPTLPNGQSTPARVYVRAEVVVTHADFKRYFPGESNPRNTANGTMKRQSDPAKCAHLTIIAYNLMPNGVSMDKKSIELRALQTMGFQTPQWSICVTLADMEALYQDYIANKRKNIGYDIDGLVVEIDDTVVREALGDLNNRPKGSVAYKFPHEVKETTLRNVRWQVGNSGRLTPVAEFDVVNLAGANVQQASLHNISYMRELVTVVHGVGQFPCEGDNILVSRRNDVVPYVESIITQACGSPIEFRPPTNCPSCKAAVQRDGEYLVCRNEDCEAQAAGAIKRWVKKVGVRHVGDSLIESLIEAGFIEDPADMYTLDPIAVADLEIGGRRVGGTADKAIKNLNAKMVMPIHVFVGSLGINLIGQSMAQTIADAGFNTLSKMLKAKIADIAAIPGVGQTKAESFVLGFNAKAGLVGKLLSNGIKIQQASGVLLGQTFCLTDFRNGDLTAALKKAGASEKSGVSKGLTFLIALDPSGTTVKAQKARSYGTKVISEEEAWDLVGGKP